MKSDSQGRRNNGVSDEVLDKLLAGLIPLTVSKNGNREGPLDSKSRHGPLYNTCTEQVSFTVIRR